MIAVTIIARSGIVSDKAPLWKVFEKMIPISPPGMNAAIGFFNVNIKANRTPTKQRPQSSMRAETPDTKTKELEIAPTEKIDKFAKLDLKLFILIAAPVAGAVPYI